MWVLVGYWHTGRALKVTEAVHESAVRSLRMVFGLGFIPDDLNVFLIGINTVELVSVFRVCLPICLSSVRPPVCLSVCLLAYLSVYLPVCLHICLPAYPSFLSVYLSVCLHTCLPAYPSFLSVYPSVSVCLYLPPPPQSAKTSPAR